MFERPSNDANAEGKSVKTKGRKTGTNKVLNVKACFIIKDYDSDNNVGCFYITSTEKQCKPF